MTGSGIADTMRFTLTPLSNSGGRNVNVSGLPAILIIAAFLGGLAYLLWRFFYYRRRVNAISERAHMQYRALFASSPVGMFTYDTRTQKVLEGNPAFAEVIGYGLDEISQLTLGDIFPADVVADAKRVYGSGELMPPQLHPIYTKVRRRDGVEIDVDARGRPMDPELGHARVVMLLDVTEQLAAERALRDAELRARTASELLQSIIEVTPLAIVATDLDLNVTMWNRAAEELFGWTSDEVLGIRAPFISEDEMPTVVAGLETVLRQGTVRNYDTSRLRKDGTRISLMGATGVRYSAEGVPVGYVVVYTDMRQYRALEAQLRQSQKMEAVGRLAGGVAHDFNNMLTVITAYVQILREEHPDDEMTQPLLEIQGAASRAAALTRQLLTFSRLQVVTVSTVDVTDVLQRLEPMLRRVSAANIDIRTTFATDLGCVRVDPAQLEQVIVNLAMNAMDSMPDGGSLLLETANVELDADYVRAHQDVVAGSYVMIAVTDSGTGMDTATIAKIFEPFYTTKPAGQGTGLGLAIAYSVVKQANGHIWVYSEPGAGTTFKLFLPRMEPTDADESASSRVPVMPRGGTILLVEDDTAVRKSVNATLVRLGYKVVEADSGEAALECLRTYTGRIDAMLTDLMMPGMSGRQLSERVMRMRPRLRVLFMSGYTDDEVLRRQLVEEGQQFLQKPFTSEQLVSAIETITPVAVRA